MSETDPAPVTPPEPPSWGWATRLRWLGLAVATLGLMPMAEWLGWHDSEFSLVGGLISYGLTFVVVAAVLGFPVFLIGCCLPHYQKRASWLLLCSFVAIICFGYSFSLSLPIKRQALHQVMARAEPLIIAIHRFEREHGNPPPNLAALVPDYLAAVPTPGIPTSREYYYRRPAPEDDLEGNLWMLDVNPPILGIGFDRFIYLPKQNYPREGWGGVLERMGTWAYVHE